jgi:hypothetical protein
MIERGKEWKLESGILPDFEIKNRQKGGKKRNK